MIQSGQGVFGVGLNTGDFKELTVKPDGTFEIGDMGVDSIGERTLLGTKYTFNGVEYMITGDDGSIKDKALDTQFSMTVVRLSDKHS